MENYSYDIFISYKRDKSLPTASLLHYRFSSLGYSVFQDIEDMHAGDFEEQLYRYIDNAKDICFVVDKGSLDSWIPYDHHGNSSELYKTDWCYKEISYAIKHRKNIIPIYNECSHPKEKDLPDDVVSLLKLQSLEFSYYHVESSMKKLLSMLQSEANRVVKNKSVFKLYSNKDCKVYNGCNTIGEIQAYADEPIYWYVERKGEFRFRAKSTDNETQIIDASINTEEEKIVHFFKKKKKRIMPIMIVSIMFLLFDVYLYALLFYQQNGSEGFIKEILMNNHIKQDIQRVSVMTSGEIEVTSEK